jgi:hypothetical protein
MLAAIFPWREGRMQREILAAEQALLFTGDEQHHHRTPRPLRQRREGARHGQELRTPGGIVLGAVVDLVAGLVRLADAEVIVVRAVNHHFVLELRIAARQHARHVGVRTRETGVIEA